MINKKCKKLERVYKGVANHRRVEILLLLKKNDKMSLNDIADELGCNFKTISEHSKRLFAAGLINKKYKGNSVIHSLSPFGEKIIKTFKLFSNSQEY